MRCRPGDWAVVVSAVNKQNIGKIVRVLRAYDGAGDILLVGTGPQWLVQCSVPIVWGWPGKKPTHRRKVGPALDSQLQPIRGSGQGPGGTTGMKTQLPVSIHS